jgi:FAD/FMN-containing dehydrogenase
MYPPPHMTYMQVDVSGLDAVIGLRQVDDGSWEMLVEPRVTMEQLVRAAAAYNLRPPVVPEFRRITVGGSIAGIAGLCVCVCVCACIYTCMHVCVCVCVCIIVCLSVRARARARVYTQTQAHTHTHTGESSSFKHGFFHDTCTGYEIVTGDGTIVTATPTNSYADLFHATPGSYGSLGIVTAATIRLLPTSGYVAMTYTHFDRVEDLVSYLADAELR